MSQPFEESLNNMTKGPHLPLKEGVMKKRPLCLFFLFLSLSLLGCSQEPPRSGKILARINDYNLTLDEFQRQLAADMEWDKDFKLTKEAKRDFLEELIRKEVLIQEAKRLNLDRKEKFVRAIERYWESTLIRNLMDLEGKEIDRKTYLSQEEILAHYKTMKESGEALPPLSHIEDKITRELREEKKSRMLKEWVNDLREKAKIEIDQELLLKY